METVTEIVKQTYEKLAKKPDEFTERDRIVLSFPVFNIPKHIQNDILEAYDHYQLKPNEFDGTTGAEEQWVSLYEPSSMRHDLDYQTFGGTYKGRLYADLKFLYYKTLYRSGSLWSNIQYYAVRWGGNLFQILNYYKGNVSMHNELVSLKRTKTQKVIEILGYVTVLPFLLCFVGAIVFEIKHKISNGWSLSINWIKKVLKQL